MFLANLPSHLWDPVLQTSHLASDLWGRAIRIFALCYGGLLPQISGSSWVLLTAHNLRAYPVTDSNAYT